MECLKDSFAQKKSSKKSIKEIEERIKELFERYEIVNIRDKYYIGKRINDFEWVLGKKLTDFS
jgi:phosphopantetheine adenylyltransferase